MTYMVYGRLAGNYTPYWADPSVSYDQLTIHHKLTPGFFWQDTEAGSFIKGVPTHTPEPGFVFTCGQEDFRQDPGVPLSRSPHVGISVCGISPEIPSAFSGHPLYLEDGNIIIAFTTRLADFTSKTAYSKFSHEHATGYREESRLELSLQPHFVESRPRGSNLWNAVLLTVIFQPDVQSPVKKRYLIRRPSTRPRLTISEVGYA